MSTILIIEDNSGISENVCEMLELKGHVTIAAAHGREGLEMVRSAMPDLILCDIMMPFMDGYEVLKTLKDDPLTASIPFIFLSASTEKKDVEIGLSKGADAYIRKPFEEEELFGVVAACLQKRL